MITTKPEKGVLVLEDLCGGRERPYYMADKGAVPSVEHVRLVFRTLGHFHGAWWANLNGEEKIYGLDKEALSEEFKGPWTKLAIAQNLKGVKRMLIKFLVNRGADCDQALLARK